MTGPFGTAEVLETAPAPWGPTQAARRHPRLAAAAVAALVAVAGGVWWAVRAAQPDPDQPPVVVARPVDLPDVRTSALWRTDTSGRATGLVTLALPSRLEVTDPQDRPVNVLGITGPGVAPPPNPVRRTVRDGPTLYRFVVRADCDAVPVAPVAYGVAVVVQDVEGERELQAPVDAASGWGDQVSAACAAYRAARDVTVTAVTATVSPTRPQIDLAVTITNNSIATASVVGAPATSTEVDAPSSTLPAGPVQIPAGATTVVRVRQSIVPCGAGRRFLPDAADSQLLLGLMSSVGDDPTANPWAGGVPVEPQARQAVLTARAQACGGVRDVLAVTPPGSFEVRDAGRTVLVRVAVDVTPGTVRSLRVRPVVRAPWSATPSGPVVPDSSGQAVTTLTYRRAGGSRCQAIPLPLDVDLKVRDTARGTVTFRTALLPQGTTDQLAVLCGTGASTAM